jgi:hypothetical protein
MHAYHPCSAAGASAAFFYLSRIARCIRRAKYKERGAKMIEDTVFQHLHAMLKTEHALPVQSCRVSMPVQRPWGRPYRLVEWTTQNDRPSYRCVVPAESTDADIARAVAAHVPGRLYTSDPI